MMILKRVNRPRDLKWYQAGALLYGDWGTSKAYVLGIAFALSGHASWFFLGLMAALTAVVGVCYMIICKLFPDGGGVYSALKSRSKMLAMVGALLLVADYVVTASLSALDAFHYFNLPHPELWAIGSIVVIGLINLLGPGKASWAATLIAILASLAALILFAFTIPHLPHVELTMPSHDWPKNWSTFVGIVLALSGVEAVANMTGIMVKPVEKTSRKAILPVLLEVSLLTFLLGVAMNAIPGLMPGEHTEDMLRALANHYVGPWYGVIVSVVFGFLLLSAANTAVTALVNIQFSLAKDRELPEIFSKLNRFGMPWLPLFVAVSIPIAVLLFESDMVGLASLYAVGVVGAISLNLTTCATNFKLAVNPWERGLLMVSAAILVFVEITICIQKVNAFIFVATIIGGGLALRQLTKFVTRPAISIPLGETAVNVLTVEEAVELESLYRGSTLVALKYLNMNLLEEVALRAKAQEENTVYLAYVEEAPASSLLPEEVEPSRESLEVLIRSQQELEKKGIIAVPVWQMGPNPGRLIASAAKALGVKTVLIGTTKKSALVNMLRGEIFRALAKHLPREIRLVVTG